MLIYDYLYMNIYVYLSYFISFWNYFIIKIENMAIYVFKI